MSATAIRTGRVPDHRDDDGHNRYAVKTDQYGRIKPFSTYALQAWYEEERNAPLWAAQQFCVYVIDNELGTCPLRDKLNLFYVDVQAAFKVRSNADKDSIIARYKELVDEYNSTIDLSNASDQRIAPVAADSTDRPVAEPAPVVTTPAPTPAPVASPEPDVTVHRTPEPAPEPTRVATDEPRRVNHQDDTQAPAWFSSFREELEPTLRDAREDHNLLHGDNGVLEKIDNHEERLGALEAVMPRNTNGTFLHHSEWFDRTVNHEVTVAGRKFKWVWAVVAFFVALLLAMTFNSPTWWEDGFWYSITWGKTLFAGLVAIAVLILTNLNSLKSASAA